MLTDPSVLVTGRTAVTWPGRAAAALGCDSGSPSDSSSVPQWRAMFPRQVLGAHASGH